MTKVLLAANGLNGFLQLITVTICFVFVLFLTAYTTKWVGKYQKQKLSGKNLEVVEAMSLPGNKIIEIVRTGDEYVVIAVCKDTITLLNKCSEEQLDFSVYEKSVEGDISFSHILEKWKEKIDSTKGNGSHDEKEKEDSDE